MAKTEPKTLAERALAEMDPQMAAHARKMAAMAKPYGDPYERPLAETREIVGKLFGYWAKGGPRMQRRAHHHFDGPDGTRILLRIHYPVAKRPLPVVVYMHGGGWTINSIDTHDRLMRECARRSGAAVLAVNYSKAPEHKFPAALNECVALVRWLRKQGRGWGLDPKRIMVGGDSAGAQLALGTCLVLRDACEDILAGQILIYGGFACDFETESYKRFGEGGYLMTAADVKMFWDYYLNNERERTHPLATPLNARLDGLPPTIVIAAGMDVLLDENVAVAGKLWTARVPCDLVVYDGVCHGFMRLPHVVDTAARAHDDLARWIRQRFKT